MTNINSCENCTHYPVCENKNYNIVKPCDFYKEEKKGEWTHYLGCGVGKAVCSECGQLGETKKYCGNCGADMKEGERGDYR